MDTAAGTVATIAYAATPTPTTAAGCALAYVRIPDGSFDGITPLGSGLSTVAFQNVFCGDVMATAISTVAMTITCKSVFIFIFDCLHSILSAARTPFTLGVWSQGAQNVGPGNYGFSLDYTQVLLVKLK